jgi:hypothetical protein
LSKMNKEMSLDQSEKLWQSAMGDRFWYIRKESLQMLIDLPDSVYKPLLPQIENMAQSDKKSIVRSWALGFLQDKEGAKGINIYFKALNDSSYNVVATAIRNIFSDNPREDSAKLVQMLQKYENYRSSEVKLALANVYAWYADSSKISFFKGLRSYGNQYYGFYKRYLERMSCENINAQKSYILSLDKYAKTAWDLSMYQNFLNDLASGLKKRTEDAHTALCKKLAGELQDKAKGLIIKF